MINSNYVHLQKVHLLQDSEILVVSSNKLQESMIIRILPHKIDGKRINLTDIDEIKDLYFNGASSLRYNNHFTQIWTGEDGCAYFIPESNQGDMGICVTEYFDEAVNTERLALCKVHVLGWKDFKNNQSHKNSICL